MSGPILTEAQRASLTAQALAAPPPSSEQRRRLRPLLAGTLPDSLTERARLEAAKAPELVPGSEQWNALAAIISSIPDENGFVAPAPIPSPVMVIPAAEPVAVRHFLYRYWDACGCLLYVGITGDFHSRDGSHERSSPWYYLATRHKVEELPSEPEAREAELTAIRSEHPVFNAAGRPRVTQTTLILEYARAHAVAGRQT